MPEPLKPPIILLGNVRSGTSMMHGLFNQHPDVVAWYEPRTVWMYADPGRPHDRFDASDASPRVVRYIRGRFLKHQRRHGNRRVMEKTPSNLMRIPYVRAIFPEAKFLYLVRHPLSYISSSELKWQKAITLRRAWDRFREVPKTQLPHYVGRVFTDHFRKRVLKQKYVSVWGVRYPGIYEDLGRLSVEQVVAKQWAMCSRQAERDLAEVDPARFLRMRYDDFVRDPVNEFGRICAHFDLDLPDSLARHIEATVDPNRQQKWRRMDPDVLRACLPLLEQEMRRHGYTVPPELLESDSSSSVERVGAAG